MAKTVGIGIQDYAEIIEKNCFYVDKSSFTREWWESRDKVTLIAWPRRFGKTLNMSMLDYLAELLEEPDKNTGQIEHLWAMNEKFSVLTNNTQNIYYDIFR